MVTAHLRSAFIAAGLLAGCTTSASDKPIGPPAVAHIAIEAATPTVWTATYRLPAPATELVFMRQPDDSRTKDWKPASDFEIVRTDNAERLRRKDRAPFDSAQVDVPAAYRDLPMDYAPFSPFGDGGMLAYTGRLFACPTECADSAAFDLSLKATGHAILVNGVRHRDTAAWTDSAEGRSIYVGETAPVETPDFLAVIDTALPDAIRTQLAADLPGFMHFFADRMGALAERPMLFTSYDLKHQGGWGRQGGTLPGQVFVHFYGPNWPAEMAKPGFSADLAWHFAHEAAHLYQSQIYIGDDDASWIHEGGAEAFAAIAMRAQGQGKAADAHVAASAKTCHDKIAGRSIRAALTAGEYEVAYACGLQVNLGLDAELRRIAPASDGLFSVWRAYRDAVAGRAATTDDFYAAIAKVGNPATAAFVRKAVDTPFVSGSGGSGQW